jgi:hypothetical protein
MSEKESTHGLACPNCGGMVPVPEGQVIVHCPYCELRSLVRGERGIQRYQIPKKIERQQAEAKLKSFLTGHREIASDAARSAKLDEAFLAYIPFWASWTRVLGWVFGEKRISDGDKTHYEPREVQVSEDATWNEAACDVGEFGVETAPLGNQPLVAFDPEVLHATGMVFEPVTSSTEARQAADAYFQGRVQASAHLDRIGQVFVRLVRHRFGLVYYPLWVLRYLYKGRSFQVAIDGYSGEILYGKAPGNTLYRATILVGGMAMGAALAVDGSALMAYLGTSSHGDSGSGMLAAALIALIAGIGIMGAAYRTFRYGEQYEFRRKGKAGLDQLFGAQNIIGNIQDMDKWINLLS